MRELDLSCEVLAQNQYPPKIVVIWATSEAEAGANNRSGIR